MGTAGLEFRVTIVPGCAPIATSMAIRPWGESSGQTRQETGEMRVERNPALLRPERAETNRNSGGFGGPDELEI